MEDTTALCSHRALFADILGCVYSPSFSPAALDIFSQMLLICFSVNPKPPNVQRDKGAAVL